MANAPGKFDQPTSEERRTQLSIERSRQARQRTLLANERTLSAWLRTGLAAIAGGLAIAKFLAVPNAGSLPLATGMLLILFGAFIVLLATWRYNRITREIKDASLQLIPHWAIWAIAIVLILIVLLVLALTLIP